MMLKNWVRKSAIATLLVLMSSVAVCVAMERTTAPQLPDQTAAPALVDRDLAKLKALLERNPIDSDDAEDAFQRLDDLILDTKYSAGLDATAELLKKVPKPDARRAARAGTLAKVLELRKRVEELRVIDAAPRMARRPDGAKTDGTRPMRQTDGAKTGRTDRCAKSDRQDGRRRRTAKTDGTRPTAQDRRRQDRWRQDRRRQDGRRQDRWRQ